MYVESFIANFLTALKTRLPEFNYLAKELWSPTTEFDDRLLSYVVKEDISQQLETKDWIGLIWTCSVMDLATNYGKPMYLEVKDLLNLTGEKYDVTFKRVSFDIGVFSDEPHECLKYMEMFSLMFDRAFTFNVMYDTPFFGEFFEQNVEGITNSEFTKLDRDTRGSLTKFGFNFTADIPIARFKEAGKLIGQTEEDEFGNKHAKICLNENIPQSYLDNLCPSFIVI